MQNNQVIPNAKDLACLFLIALSGNIGSGKSSAAKIFEELGARIIDADILARNAVIKGSHTLNQIEQEFGSSFITSSGELDRKKLATLIFSDKLAKQKLEAITHPAIRKLFFAELKQLSVDKEQQAKTIVIYVVPLFYESGINYSEIQKVLVVYAPKEICIRRITERDHCSKSEAEQKYNSQLPIEIKKQKADFVVDNSSTLEQLRINCEVVYQEILALSIITSDESP